MNKERVLQIYSPANQRLEGPFVLRLDIEPANIASYFFFELIRKNSGEYRDQIYTESKLEEGVLEMKLNLREISQMFLGFHSSIEVSNFLMNFAKDDEVTEQIIKRGIAPLDEKLVYTYLERGTKRIGGKKSARRLITKTRNLELINQRLPKSSFRGIDENYYSYNWERWTEFMGDPKEYTHTRPVKIGCSEISERIWGSEIEDKRAILCLLKEDFGRQPILPDELNYPNFVEQLDTKHWNKYFEEKPDMIKRLWTGDKELRKLIYEKIKG